MKACEEKLHFVVPARDPLRALKDARNSSLIFSRFFCIKNNNNISSQK